MRKSTKKDPAAQSMGKKRMGGMSKKALRAHQQKAARARWKKENKKP